MNFSRINSPIVKVHWAGWESDTLRLQQAGWQLSMEEDVCRRVARLALKHPHFKMYGLSEMVDINRSNPMNPYHQEMRLVMRQMASELVVRLMDNFSKFQAIDAEPLFIQEEIRSIEDCRIFRPIRQAEQQIIVPKHSVPELLDQILKLQDPKQYEIREKKRKEIRRFMREATDIEAGQLDERLLAEVLVG